MTCQPRATVMAYFSAAVGPFREVRVAHEVVTACEDCNTRIYQLPCWRAHRCRLTSETVVTPASGIGISHCYCRVWDGSVSGQQHQEH
jgi:hypothetical protein